MSHISDLSLGGGGVGGLRLLFAPFRMNIQNVMIALMALQHNLGAMQQCINRDQQVEINSLRTTLANQVSGLGIGMTTARASGYTGTSSLTPPYAAVPEPTRIPKTPTATDWPPGTPDSESRRNAQKRKAEADPDWDKNLGHKRGGAEGGGGPEGGAGGGGGSASGAGGGGCGGGSAIAAS